MKKTLLILAVTIMAIAGSSAVASAGSYSRGHSRHGYYRPHVQARVVYAPVIVYRSVPVYRPVIVASPYWHRHYEGGRYMECHFYGGAHHYGYYNAPRVGFHIGVSIFR